MQPQPAAVQAITKILAGIVDAVAEAGPAGYPDGNLYAHLQSILGPCWTLQRHEEFIGALVDSGKLLRRGHLLVATGSQS